MDAITQWFKDKDYDAGVQLYAELPSCKSRILQSLKRGRNDRNMATLINALRSYKNDLQPKQKPKLKPPVKQITPEVLKAEGKSLPQVEAERKQAATKSAESYFQRIRYGELPSELKLRFREAKDIFYDMCDLKFRLNDLPENAEEEALKIMLQIDSLDSQRETIWKELEHWQNYKTILPSKTDEDFSKMTPQKLFLRKASIASSISKISKRIEGWKEAAAQEKDKSDRIKIEQQINRSEKKLHQHEINLRKIEEILS